MKKRFLFLCLLFLVRGQLPAQQLPTLPFFEGTQFAWNPGMTASWDYLEASANYFQQWSGFDGNPTQIALGIQYPFTDLNMGLGAQLLQDETGPLRQTSITLTYAYHLPIGYRSRLSIGILARAGQLRYDPSGEVVNDLDDPRLASEIGNTNHFNAGVGILFRGADTDEQLESHFFAGLSLHQAVPQSLSLDNILEQISFDQVWHANAIAGYRANIGDAYVEPSVQIDYAADNIILPRFNILLEMEDSFWAGLSLDGNFGANLQIGYIINTGDYWTVRIGAFAGSNLGSQASNQGASYGGLASYRLGGL